MLPFLLVVIKPFYTLTLKQLTVIRLRLGKSLKTCNISELISEKLFVSVCTT